MKKITQKGFTLIELMIVVAIIGILAAVALPKFADMIEKSREGATQGNIGSIKSSIAIYQGDMQGFKPQVLHRTSDQTKYTAGDPVYTPWFSDNGVASKIGLSAYLDNIPQVKCTGKYNKGTYTSPASTGLQNPDSVSYAGFVNGIAFASSPYGLALTGANIVPITGGTTANAGAIGTDGIGWRYDSLDGSVWVNSVLIGKTYDKSSYTMYGY
jgi:prepilin-type N-terminal cleavage/methylation domain-containing protein